MEASGSEDLWKGEEEVAPFSVSHTKKGSRALKVLCLLGFPLRKDHWFCVDVGLLC